MLPAGDMVNGAKMLRTMSATCSTLGGSVLNVIMVGKSCLRVLPSPVEHCRFAEMFRVTGFVSVSATADCAEKLTAKILVTPRLAFTELTADSVGEHWAVFCAVAVEEMLAVSSVRENLLPTPRAARTRTAPETVRRKAWTHRQSPDILVIYLN